MAPTAGLGYLKLILWHDTNNGEQSSRWLPALAASASVVVSNIRVKCHFDWVASAFAL